MGTSTRSPTAIIAEEYLFIRRAIADWFARQGVCEVVAMVGSGGELVEAARRFKPNLVWVDIDLPGQSATAAMDQIRRVSEGTHVISCVAAARDSEIEQALTAKSEGIVSKADAPEAITAVIGSVLQGGQHFSPLVHQRLVSARSGGEGGAPAFRTKTHALTPRELEVLRYVAKGMSKRAVAEIMFISPRTVERHVANIMSTLDIHDRVDLSRFAIREGMVKA